MSDFEFLQNPYSKKWVILSPRRAKRPNELIAAAKACPFCPGNEKSEEEVYRYPPLPPERSPSVTIQVQDATSSSDGGRPKAMTPPRWMDNWQIRVVTNKYPFAPIHEIVVHSPDHHKNFDELPIFQSELIFQTYRQRFNTHKDEGNVIIFHNFAADSGASVSHPHSQLAVIPKHIDIEIPPYVLPDNDAYETPHFTLFCPMTSQWPDEVWIVPKNREGTFGDTNDAEINDLSFIVSRLVQILDLRHGHEFSYNFYISPWWNWYLRFIPRVKKIGGFELATGVFVNTQDPAETIAFIKEHFAAPNKEKILKEHQAKYHRGV